MFNLFKTLQRRTVYASLQAYSTRVMPMPVRTFSRATKSDSSDDEVESFAGRDKISELIEEEFHEMPY